MTDSVFETAFAALLPFEGGYADDPNDPGGETNFGISKRAYPSVDIKNLTQIQAHDIYFTDYWNRFGLWRLPPHVGAKLFICGVNTGMSSAFVCLQRALRACGQEVKEDGKLGDETLGVLNKVQYDALAAALKSELAAHYRLVAQKENSSEYLAGWLKRCYA